MWDPAIIFDEVRRGRVAGYERRFVLKDVLGGRGDYEKPGLMAALDDGTGCDGLIFRIASHRVDGESFRLFSREKAIPAYHATFVDVQTAEGTETALTFVADHKAEVIDTQISRADQVQFLATGTGFLGSSLDYARNLIRHLDALAIVDTDAATLLADAEALAARG